MPRLVPQPTCCWKWLFQSQMGTLSNTGCLLGRRGRGWCYCCSLLARRLKVKANAIVHCSCCLMKWRFKSARADDATDHHCQAQEWPLLGPCKPGLKTEGRVNSAVDSALEDDKKQNILWHLVPWYILKPNNIPLTRDILCKESSKSLFVNSDFNFFLGCLSFENSAFEKRSKTLFFVELFLLLKTQWITDEVK